MQDEDRLAAAASELLHLAKAGLRDESFGRRPQLVQQAATLNALRPITSAGQDSNARFEYLVQAIVDAIDELARSGNDHGTSNGHPEAAALRDLFGLTDETRRASWRPRQDAAARRLHVSWEHFRRTKQPMLIQR
jgi:hypothetical protein